MPNFFSKRAFFAILFAVMALPGAVAQDADRMTVETIPDAPGAVESPQRMDATLGADSGGQVQSSSQQTKPDQQNSSLEGMQTKRILGIVPNFRSVSVNEKLPPQSVKDKLIETTEDSFDYSSFIFAGLLAGITQVEDSYSEFHQGAAGFGRYYWHTFADQTCENYQVEFLFPVVLHQDARYYTLGHGGLFKRTAYSFSRVLITRTDSGQETFNVSEIVGAGAASGISDLYYPSPERT
jgi:hypothetical protein